MKNFITLFTLCSLLSISAFATNLSLGDAAVATHQKSAGKIINVTESAIIQADGSEIDLDPSDVHPIQSVMNSVCDLSRQWNVFLANNNFEEAYCIAK